MTYETAVFVQLLVIYNYRTICFMQSCVHLNLTSTRGVHRQMGDFY